MTEKNKNTRARGNFVFDQSLHLLTFEGLDQSEYTITSRQWRKLWKAVGKTSPPNIVFLTVVIQLWTEFISLHQSLINFETFYRCNFRLIVLLKRNRFLNNTKIRAFDGNSISLGPMSNIRLFALSTALSAKKIRRFFEVFATATQKCKFF